ncbi:MAG: hypothetical protein RLZZ431_1461 [Bacteroidota bacterium]|jgi:hypothetical protein
MRILIFLSFLISLTGCVKSNPDLIQIIKGDPASQLALWKKKGVSNYEMTMKISCYCIQGRVGPHHIIVENDKIKTVNNLPYDSTKTGPILTINELFDFIIISLAKNPYQHFLDYNAIFHYPKYIYFDFSQQIADDEIGYEITDFKAL